MTEVVKHCWRCWTFFILFQNSFFPFSNNSSSLHKWAQTAIRNLVNYHLIRWLFQYICRCFRKVYLIEAFKIRLSYEMFLFLICGSLKEKKTRSQDIFLSKWRFFLLIKLSKSCKFTFEIHNLLNFQIVDEVFKETVFDRDSWVESKK